MSHFLFDAPERSARVGFAGNPLDRLSENRDDAARLDLWRADPRARIMVIARDTPVMKAGAAPDPFFTLEEAAGLGEPRETAFLGIGLDGAPFFAVQLDDSAIVATPNDKGQIDASGFSIPGRDGLFFKDLRSLGVQRLLTREATAMYAQAKALMHWHARHRFCANCGQPTRVAASGWRRECDACKAQHFPRTDPVVIMLAIHGDKCLLGRQARFVKGMYSALAGFVEPGETLEEAVRREIFEESGVKCGRVSYLASQPWPFPASLMIGALAEATSAELVIDHNELEDARWFPRAEILSMFEGTHPDGLTAPVHLAIAHHILHAWAYEGARA